MLKLRACLNHRENARSCTLRAAGQGSNEDLLAGGQG